MNSVYFDVHDIVSDDQRVKVKVLCSIPWSGLGGSSDGGDEIIDKNSVIELPLWLATHLVRSPFAERVLPRAFSTRLRSDLNANPMNVPLRDAATCYYSLGLKMLEDFSGHKVSELLYTTFKDRLLLMLRPLQCTSDITGISPLEAHAVDTLGVCPPTKLDAAEYNIFQMANVARKQHDAWLRRDMLRIRAQTD